MTTTGVMLPRMAPPVSIRIEAAMLTGSVGKDRGSSRIMMTAALTRMMAAMLIRIAAII